MIIQVTSSLDVHVETEMTTWINNDWGRTDCGFSLSPTRQTAVQNVGLLEIKISRYIYGSYSTDRQTDRPNLLVFSTISETVKIIK